MKLLDKYILQKFISTFFFVVLLFILILSVIDFTEKNEDFIKNKVPGIEILGYYMHFMPYMANLLSPITVFIATVFVTAKMASHTEIVAILSSGVSFKRFMLPYLIGATFIGIGTFILIEWVIPNGNKKRIAFENQYIKEKVEFRDNAHLKIGPNTYVYLLSYNNNNNEGYQFSLETIENNELKSKLKSNRIIWQPKKNCWKLDKYVVRNFDGDKEFVVRGENKDTIINLLPKDFGSTYQLHETFTMTELDNYIAELRDRGAENIEIYLTEKYERYTYPFAIVILTAIGVIVSARKTREGAGFQIAFGFLLAFVYILFVLMSRGIASVGSIGPLLASWIPNIIFSCIGVVMYKTVPR
ncbi:MAG: LptF/LptG family permease [Cytophagaceae bacterium]|jgi:lipopolysaccharide export system permease protein